LTTKFTRCTASSVASRSSLAVKCQANHSRLGRNHTEQTL